MKLNKWLNFAGVLNIVVAIVMFLISNVTIIPVVFLIFSGFFYRTYFNKEGPYERRSLLIVLGILNLLCNFISGIIVLEVSELIKNGNYEIKENKNSRINILLQLGVVLVLLSGIMIATNETFLIPNVYKIMGLLILSGIFFFLSYMSKKYLKLESSFKTYFVLAISFIVISFIGLYYYNLLGSFSLNGFNYLYFYPMLFILIGICLTIIAKFLNWSNIYNLTVVSCFLTVFSWFNALGLGIVLNLFIIAISCFLINFIYNPSCTLTKVVKETTYYLSLILVPINIIAVLNNNFDISSCLLAIVTTLNIFHLFIIKKNNVMSLMVLPTLLINSLLVVGMNDEILEIKFVFFQVIVIVFYYLIRLINLESINDLFKKIFRIIFNIVFIITAFGSLFVNSTASLIVTALLLAQNVIGLINQEKNEKILEPFKTLLFIIGLIYFINSNIKFDIIFNLFIIEVIELILYLIDKNNISKKIHYFMYIILVGIISLISVECGDIYLVLIALISIIIPFILSILKKNEDNIPLLVFTTATLIIVNSNDVFENVYYLNYAITLILMFGYAYLFKNDSNKKYISLFGSSILMFSFNHIAVFDYSIYRSLDLLIYSYIGVLIASLISRNDSKDIFLSVFLTISCIFNIFSSDIMLSITVSLVTILMVIFGFIKDFKKIKITGIILFILNLIYVLRDFWKDIPLAIYLLVLGLLLIGIVVVKEIKENKD